MMKRFGALLLGVMLMTGWTTQGWPQEAPREGVQVIAHRGASAYAPENTLAAFALAAQMKSDWFELDCLLSRDGEVVISHDSTLDRTTSGKGWVVDHTLAQLKALDAGSWKDAKFAGERLPTLRESLELTRREKIGCYIEIKDVNEKRNPAKGESKRLDKALDETLLGLAGDRVLTKDPAFAKEVMQAIETFKTPNLELTRKTVALVRELGLQKQVVIQSFSPIVCAIVRAEAPELRVGLLVDDKPKTPAIWNNFLRFERMIDVQECNISDKSTTAERVKAFHDAGRTVAVWTVDDPKEMKRQVGMGVDKIITNKPDLTLQTLRELGKR